MVRVFGRIGFREPGADDAKLLARLIGRDIVAQPADYLEEMRRAQGAIVVVERERHHDIGSRRPPKLRRKYANDLERVAVERDRPADDRRIGTKAPAPELIRKQHDAVPADGFLLRPEVAAERRRQADYAEKRR